MVIMYLFVHRSLGELANKLIIYTNIISLIDFTVTFYKTVSNISKINSDYFYRI